MVTHLKKTDDLRPEQIAAKYIQIITQIAQMVECGDPVADLSLVALGHCISAMHSAGAATVDIKRILSEKFEAELALADESRKKLRAVLEETHTRTEQLLFDYDSIYGTGGRKLIPLHADTNYLKNYRGAN